MPEAADLQLLRDSVYTWKMDRSYVDMELRPKPSETSPGNQPTRTAISRGSQWLLLRQIAGTQTRTQQLVQEAKQ